MTWPRPSGPRAGRVFALVLACWAGTAASQPAELHEHEAALPSVAAPGYRAHIEPHELWVVELRLGRELLNPGILAIDRGDQMLLPLSEIADAFELAIEVDPTRARALGYIIHPNRGFELDLSDHELRIEGRAWDLQESQIVIWSQDIYVDTRTLSRWLPIDLDVQRRHLSVRVDSREPLPVELRLNRERMHQRLGMRPADGSTSAREDGYRWWTAPALDVNLRSRTRRPQAGGRHELTNSYDIASAGDVLKLRTHLLTSGDDDGNLRLRARAGRVDYEGRMGGPLRLHEFTLGDVSTPALSQLSRSNSGRGLQISSFPLRHLNELGQLTLEGDLRPGYQVELYRGEVLLDFQSSRDDLRYRFENIPTVPGLNELRLVFYGPRGEVREESERFWSDGGLADAGEARFRLTANQHDQDTFARGDMAGSSELRGDPRAFGEFEYGLTEGLTLALSGATIPLIEGRHHYGSAGLRTEIDGHLFRVEGLGSHTGGYAAGAGWQTRIGNQSLGFTHHELRNFLSERTQQFGKKRLRGRSEVSLDGRLGAWKLPLAYRVSAGHSRLTRGNVNFDGQFRLSTWLRPVSLSHTFRGQLRRDLDTGSETLSGDFLASFRQGPIGLRGRFLYDAMPGQARAVSLVGDWTPQSRTTTRVGVTHAFQDNTTAFASLSRQIGAFVFSADVGVDDKGVASAGVGISFGATPDPFSGRPRWQPPGATRTGAIAARTFLDMNANGRFDADDRPLPDVGFSAYHRGGEQSNHEGTALLTSLPVDRPLDVGIDPDTLKDPHWLVPRQTERVVLRPGSPARLDFPILPTGEVDGWVRRTSRGTTHPAPGITVQLIDTEDDAVVQSVRSEVDGFYIFQGILPGQYTIQVDPDQAQRLGLVSNLERALEVRGAGSVYRQDFELRVR